MNIFCLDRDPYTAATYMCDKHIVKMIIETCQILSCVVDERTPSSDRLGMTVSEEWNLPQYPKAHSKHPSTLWAKQSLGNSRWLVKHLHGLVQEYTKRYEKKHKMDMYYKDYILLLEYCKFDTEKQTEFVQAITNKDLHREDPVEGYREYYNKEKSRFAKWKLGNVPYWFKNEYVPV